MYAAGSLSLILHELQEVNLACDGCLSSQRARLLKLRPLDFMQYMVSISASTHAFLTKKAGLHLLQQLHG